ncbi:hypothetical protein BH11BAC1_BH11BAC1_28610 [soil metagenome]
MKKQLLVYLIFLSAGYLICDENHRTEYGSHDNHLMEYQQGVIVHSITGPLAYRILIPYTLQALSKFSPGQPLIEIVFYLNVLLMLLVQISFYKYLNNFVSISASFAGTMWLALIAMMGLGSFMGVHVYETTDLCNLLVMCLALQFLYKRKWNRLALLLVIGMINRETPAFLLIPAFLLWRKEKFQMGYLLLLLGSVVIPYLSLRLLIHPPHPAWFLTVFLGENIPFYQPGKLPVVFSAYLKFILFVGPAACIAMTDLENKNHFLKIIVWMVPAFFLVHIVVGHVEEFRMWMPLFLVLIPLCMETIDQNIINSSNGDTKIIHDKLLKQQSVRF